MNRATDAQLVANLSQDIRELSIQLATVDRYVKRGIRELRETLCGNT